MSRPYVSEGWPQEAFLGDVLVCTLKGEHLDQVTDIQVAPAAKGIEAVIGDPYGRLGGEVQQHAQALTVTVKVGFQTYPGEKRIVLVGPEGESNPLPFLIMM
ncbi:MAG: hypothetical protein HC921_12525 [Synechococcaceae cyanobacterium SM2_3_1]|nr:hypothetical protein [Synechococcaceae cyanobacterium SM2_3_1]